jgi:hypothetical protein
MAVDLRDLERRESVQVMTDLGAATMRRFVSGNRFDVVRASVEWQSSATDRWGRVTRDRGDYIAELFELLRVDEVEKTA